jgi:hypothetical protein
MSDTYAWRLKSDKVLEIFISDPETRKVLRTMRLELTKPVTDEWAVRYMEQNYPHERLVDKKGDAEDKNR